MISDTTKLKAKMGGAARSHGGTLGHGCTPLQGERPNFNLHTLSDNTLSKIVKSNKKNTVTNPSDTKVVCVNKLLAVNGAKCVHENEKVQNNEKEHDEEREFYSGKVLHSKVEKKKGTFQKVVDKEPRKQVKGKKTYHPMIDDKMSQHDNFDGKRQMLDLNAVKQVEGTKVLERRTNKQAVAKEINKMESKTNQEVKMPDLQEKADNEVINHVEIKQDMEKSTVQQNADHDVSHGKDVRKVTEGMIDKKESGQAPNKREKEDWKSLQDDGNSRNKVLDAKSFQQAQNEKAYNQLLHDRERKQMMDEKARQQAVRKMLDENAREQMLGEKAREKMLDEKTREQMTDVREQLLHEKPTEYLVEDKMLDQTNGVDNNLVCQNQNLRKLKEDYQSNDQGPTVQMPHDAYPRSTQQEQSLSLGQLFVLLPVSQQGAMVQGASLQHQMVTVPLMPFYPEANWFIHPSIIFKNNSSQHHQSSGIGQMPSHDDD